VLPAKRYKVDQNTPIKLKPLSNQKENQEKHDNSNQNIKTVKKITPIYLSADNFHEIIKDLNQITTSEFTTKQCCSKIKTLLTSTDNFKKVTKLSLYDNAHVKHFTFINPKERPLCRYAGSSVFYFRRGSKERTL
jgi:hypothetical protein